MDRWVVLAAIVLILVFLIVRLTRRKPPSDALFR